MIKISVCKSVDGDYQSEFGDGIHAIPPDSLVGTTSLIDLDYPSAKTYGGQLLNFLVPAAKRETYQNALKEAVSASSNSPLILEVTSKELEALPWELTYDASSDRFLCLSKFTPVIRYKPFPLTGTTPATSTKLKVLVILSSPIEHSNLNLLHEKKWLGNAFASFERQNVIEVQYLENPVFEQLQELLLREKFQIIHFSGHAGFDSSRDQGYLLFEDEAGKGKRVYASIAQNLFSAGETKFIFLNACKTSSQSDSFGSLSMADSCIRAGVRWVVGMQQPISDRAALAFSKAFYTSLLSRFNILDAVTSGRQNIQNQEAAFTSEWATPVLVSSSADDFQLVSPTSNEQQSSKFDLSTDELDFSSRLDKIRIDSLKIRSTTHLRMWLATEEKRALYGLDVPIAITREIEFHKNKFTEIQLLLGRHTLSDEYKALMLKSLQKRLEYRTRALEKLRQIEAQGIEGVMKQVELSQELEFQEEECNDLQEQVANYS